ncbi:GvpL/GvpF family gas vesicle protein [Dactylosporangium sp. NPDC051485]|uniref:GvpL/GvpF family gas vesicle protein n=1 Tax=Dactylosporangium sp. NPDC051485 TaxID=3154846 RepID=UPI0034192835
MPAVTGVYVYGIVPGDVEADPEARGVGGDSTPVTVVHHGRIAAMVSELDLDRPLGTPADLLSHEALLDATAAVVPVLPVRFGAVLTHRQAVVDELLAPHHDEFDAALRELEGKAEYVISARYVRDSVLRDVIAGDPEIERLREAIRDKPEDATRNERIALGQAVNNAIDARRQADTQAVAEAVAPVADGVITREPAGEYEAAAVAVLTGLDREPELVRKVEELTERRAGQLEVRLLGPLAPYDFVTALRPGA